MPGLCFQMPMHMYILLRLLRAIKNQWLAMFTAFILLLFSSNKYIIINHPSFPQAIIHYFIYHFYEANFLSTVIVHLLMIFETHPQNLYLILS